MTIIHIPAVLTMNSREIAELTGKEHSNVMRDIRTLLLDLQASNLNPVCKSNTYIGANGQDYPQYELDKDTCLTLLLGYDAAARMRVVKRWQELEGQQHQPAELTRLELLELALESEKGRIKAEKQLALAAPKVEFVERYTQASSGSKGFRQVCKLLGVKEPVFRQFLHDTGVMYRLGGEWVPHAPHIDAGRFETKAGVAEHGDTSHAYNQAKFTPKGILWIAGEWAKAQVRGAA